MSSANPPCSRGRQTPHRRDFVGGIEEQLAAAALRFRHRQQPLGRRIHRHAHREDGVVEAQARRRVGADSSAVGIDQQQRGIDAGLRQHHAEQVGLVLAVAKAVGKYLGRGVRLEAADAQLDGHVADVPLHEC